MRVMLVVDHPYTLASHRNIPHQRSFTAALAHAAQQGLIEAGHEVDVVDLHADGFNPVMSAQDLASWRCGKVVDPQLVDYQARLDKANHVVFVFPIWWELMPAMTKGFLDRVMTKGIVYEQGESLTNFMTSKLDNLKSVTLVSTMAEPDIIYRLYFHSPVTKSMVRGTFKLMGVKKVKWHNYTGIANKTPEQRQRILESVRDRFKRMWR
ncbi:NAD(P)H dehydrogenase [Eggerthellaceae bacterium zg-997]|nr:NAD(P)H dehydrogenase [Eggerthellaceae bacterium zg-997]